MNKNNIIEIISREKPYLQKQFGVEEIGLFGSYARGEEKGDSDVDILVSIKTPNLASLIGISDYLKEKLNIKIDLTRKGPHLSSRFLNLIQRDLIYV